MRKLLHQIFDSLFPRVCIGCGCLHQEYLCSHCKKLLIPHPEWCPICHKTSPESRVCLGCRETIAPAYEGIIVGFGYQDLLKKLLLRLKFYHQRDVADFLAHRVAFLIQTHPTLATALDDQKLYVTYVPSHRIRRYRVKGYNQSLLLAQALSKILTLSLVSPLLKTKITLTQTGLSRFQRLKNLRHAFTLQNINHNTLPEDATLVIIDDVTTTGATISVVAQTLRQRFPGVRIRGAVVGRKLLKS